jgi:formylglycine-generating enzyme required for sulfatase activity
MRFEALNAQVGCSEVAMGKKFEMTGSVMAFVFILLSGAVFLSDVFCLAAGARTFINSKNMEFVIIKPGSFLMGSPPEEARRDPDEKQYTVTITRPFYLQVSEVTVDQWRSVMGRSLLGQKKGGNFPVVKVSWHDCRRFIARLNSMGEGKYRLPTEAEWEYACRAGSSTAFWWGDEIDCKKALYANNSHGVNECSSFAKERGLPAGGPVPVRSYQANPWGLYDMHGNVWEWCSDWYGPYPAGEAFDPAGPSEGSRKVRRGGSWFKHGYLCRSANRTFAHPASRYDTVGLRLVKVSE